MKCNCIEKVNENLRKASGDPSASIDLLLTFPDMEGLFYLPYTYIEKKKDGSFGKEKQGKLVLNKCPFCGIEQKQ